MGYLIRKEYRIRIKLVRFLFVYFLVLLLTVNHQTIFPVLQINCLIVDLTMGKDKKPVESVDDSTFERTNKGSHRQAAFYRRCSALEAARESDWEKCYYLLIESLSGYGLTLDPIEYEKRISERRMGWAGIHVQVLSDLVRSATEMGCEQLAIRHLSFLLQCFCEILTRQEKSDFARELESLGSKCGEGAPVNLTLDNGFTIPSVNLTKFPMVSSLKIQNLFASLRPVKLKPKSMDNLIPTSASSPFIFTPIQMSRPSSRRRSLTSPAVQNMDFKWIQGETCQITLQVSNYLPVELQVNHIALLTDGVAFQTYPTSLTLPAESGPFPIQLTGTPLNSGKLDILGYSTHVLGVKSDCRWPHLPNSSRLKLPAKYVVEVIPPLPLIDISAPDLPKSDTFTSLTTDNNAIMSNVSLTIYAGQTKTCSIKVTNNSPNNDVIEIISVKMISKLVKDIETNLVTWNDNDLNNCLPLPAQSSFDFDIKVYGISDFLSPSTKKRASSFKVKSASVSGTSSPVPNIANITNTNSLTGSPHHHPSSNTAGDSGSSKRSHILGSALANFLSELQVGSSNSNIKRKYDLVNSINLEEYQPRVIEVILEFEYSGGGGLASGYCRRSAIAINIEIIPSVLITKWDVLPAEMPSHCYLVFDVLNATNYEMELNYSENKSILIEPRETCRIPVPVERVPLMNEESSLNKVKNSKNGISLLERCKHHLVNQVNLNWSLLTTDITGVAFMSEIPWTGDLLDHIIMSSVQWDVKVNGNDLKIEEDLNFSIGEAIMLTISVTNISGNSLRDVELWVSCFQEQQNGVKNYKVDMKRSILGSDRVYIDEILNS
ncbi:protein brunelleschi [Tetranychus urticae]|uniref:protein brunelleschi n=1 Tax=Tetranychus urticae TaxID=32264 RepID=UPI000D65A5BF|nr:protein brunelleschi [Tetranychus urticae]